MDPRLLKLGLGAIFLISLASLGAILFFINPYKTGLSTRILFSVVVLMFLFSFFSLAGLWLRKKFINERNLDRIFKIVFREGALLAVLVLVFLWLCHIRLFKIWIALPLLLIFIGAEYYFLNLENRKRI